MSGEITTEDNQMDMGNFDGNQNAPENFFQSIWNDQQKRMIAIGVVAVIVILGTFLFFNSSQKDENKGKLVPLVREIDQSRAFEIVAKLKSVNIEAKVNNGERPGQYVVEVFENAVETSYLALSRTNLLEDDDYGLFDSNDWAASDYDKRIKLQRAINGDLSRIISRMDGVRSATVRVNVPEQQLFTEMQSATTATVQIELDNEGEELSKAQAKSIVNVLRGYVPNLDKEKISIVDTQGHSYNTFKEDEESANDDFIDEVEKINKIIEKRVAKYLDVVIGSGDYQASVSVSISREKVQQNQTIYSEGAVGSKQTSSEVLDSGAAANKVGPGNTQGKKYNSSNTNETHLPSFEQKSVTYLPGRITDVSVALAVDKSVPAMISLQQLRESVAAVIGPEATVDSVKITVVDMHADEAQLAVQSLEPEKKSIVASVQSAFKGGSWGFLSKVLIIIGIGFALLLLAIVGLNFLGAAANKSYETEIDPDLGNDFEEVLNDEDYEMSDDYSSDYGETDSLKQQEELLREMMAKNSAAPAASNSEPEQITQNTADDNVEFETLLNNFQNVANSKPDALAKKIQVWLDDE
jgi:flagellar biosynthesis/type III secretory pathway M-ring protein FliF/YscJ